MGNTVNSCRSQRAGKRWRLREPISLSQAQFCSVLRRQRHGSKNCHLSNIKCSTWHSMGMSIPSTRIGQLWCSRQRRMGRTMGCCKCVRSGECGSVPACYALGLRYRGWSRGSGRHQQPRNRIHRWGSAQRCVNLVGTGRSFHNSSDDELLRQPENGEQSSGPSRCTNRAAQAGFSPYFWASFELVGDPDNLVFEGSNTPSSPHVAQGLGILQQTGRRPL